MQRFTTGRQSSATNHAVVLPRVVFKFGERFRSRTADRGWRATVRRAEVRCARVQRGIRRARRVDVLSARAFRSHAHQRPRFETQATETHAAERRKTTKTKRANGKCRKEEKIENRKRKKGEAYRAFFAFFFRSSRATRVGGGVVANDVRFDCT